ncbi:hypothetical protein [Priestia megaterium]|uniref:hypothetical protein n=1 Tax=Priestia megaterium TaxID=1404 RepID=UPI00339801E0
MLRLLQESCDSKGPNKAIYMSDNGSIVNEINQKSIKPWCLLRNEKRVFKLNNILSVAPSYLKK